MRICLFVTQSDLNISRTGLYKRYTSYIIVHHVTKSIIKTQQWVHFTCTNSHYISLSFVLLFPTGRFLGRGWFAHTPDVLHVHVHVFFGSSFDRSGSFGWSGKFSACWPLLGDTVVTSTLGEVAFGIPANSVGHNRSQFMATRMGLALGWSTGCSSAPLLYSQIGTLKRLGKLVSLVGLCSRHVKKHPISHSKTGWLSRTVIGSFLMSLCLLHMLLCHLPSMS